VDPSNVAQNGPQKNKKYFLEGESSDVLYRGVNRNKNIGSTFKQKNEFLPE
jgi:hypothetical protein